MYKPKEWAHAFASWRLGILWFFCRLFIISNIINISLALCCFVFIYIYYIFLRNVSHKSNILTHSCNMRWASNKSRCWCSGKKVLKTKLSRNWMFLQILCIHLWSTSHIWLHIKSHDKRNAKCSQQFCSV